MSSPRTGTSGAAFQSNGCAGGWSTEALNYVRKFNVTTEDLYPYTGTSNFAGCRQRVGPFRGASPILKQAAPDPGYYQVPSNNVTALKQAVAYTPTVIYIRAERGFKDFSGGVYSTACTGTKVTHAVVLTGYFTSVLRPSDNYWMVKNSWGDGWGESGYMRLSMDMSAAGLNAGLCNSHKYAYYPNNAALYTGP